MAPRKQAKKRPISLAMTSGGKAMTLVGLDGLALLQIRVVPLHMPRTTGVSAAIPAPAGYRFATVALASFEWGAYYTPQADPGVFAASVGVSIESATRSSVTVRANCNFRTVAEQAADEVVVYVLVTFYG